jgi:hypothetical protein
MKSIKKSKLTELLKSKGLDEGLIDRIFNRVKMAKKKSELKDLERELKKLENDPEYKNILKKYNIEPVDYSGKAGDDYLKRAKNRR